MINFKSNHPLQTPQWAEFRKEWGNEVVKTEYGYLTLHKIPVLNKKLGIFERGPEPSQKMLADLKTLGQKHNLIFIKLEPNVLKDEKLIKVLKNNDAVPGKRFFTPTSFWLDLTKTEEELLASFSSKTRYNIRLAQKKGVEVFEDNSSEAFAKYLELMRETVKRDKFYAHSARYHTLMWEHLKNKIAHLLVAKFNGEIITAWILFQDKSFLYYPFGASTHKYKNVMANNLMMWEAIKLGKKLKLKIFDLWGREEGKGFTKFKEGYNPQVVEFIGSWDLVINKPLYYLYRLLEKTRWLFLRFKTNFQKPKF